MTNFLLLLLIIVLFGGFYFVAMGIGELTEVLKNFKTTIKVYTNKEDDDDISGEEWKKFL